MLIFALWPSLVTSSVTKSQEALRELSWEGGRGDYAVGRHKSGRPEWVFMGRSRARGSLQSVYQKVCMRTDGEEGGGSEKERSIGV